MTLKELLDSNLIRGNASIRVFKSDQYGLGDYVENYEFNRVGYAALSLSQVPNKLKNYTVKEITGHTKNKVLIVVEAEAGLNIKLSKAKNVTELAPLDENKQDSVWYAGDLLSFDFDEATETDKYRFVYYCSAIGDVEIVDSESGDYVYDKNGYPHDREMFLEDRDVYNDKDLNKAIEEEKIRFDYNNWYEDRILAVDKETGESFAIDQDFELDVSNGPFELDDDYYEYLVSIINEWKKDNNIM